MTPSGALRLTVIFPTMIRWTGVQDQAVMMINVEENNDSDGKPV